MLRAHQQWPVMPCAVLLSVAIDVRTDAAAYRGTPIPATKPARAAMAAVSRGPGGYYRERHPRRPAAEVEATQLEDLRVAARALRSARPGLALTLYYATPDAGRVRFDPVAEPRQ